MARNLSTAEVIDRTLTRENPTPITDDVINEGWYKIYNLKSIIKNSEIEPDENGNCPDWFGDPGDYVLYNYISGECSVNWMSKEWCEIVGFFTEDMDIELIRENIAHVMNAFIKEEPTYNWHEHRMLPEF